MIDAPFCNAVSLLTGFTGWVLAVWSFLRPERDRSGWKLAGGGMACALALLAQLFAVQLETVAGDLETALVQASGAAIAGRILFVITLITDRDWIGEFLQQAAEAVSTGMESVQDAPDQTGAVKVELGTGETPDWSVLYVYEADGICCLEQPYTGIYQGDEALWTVLAADAAPEGRNPQ